MGYKSHRTLSPLAHDFVQINFEQFVDGVFRFALSLSGDRHLAEDLTQDCFLRAHQHQGQLESGQATKAWLFQILANRWKDHLKKKRLNVVESEGGDHLVARHEDTMIEQEALDKLLQLMQTLPGKQRSVLYLSAVEQMAGDEIASVLGVSRNSVKANLSIARKTLRKKLLDQSERIERVENP